MRHLVITVISSLILCRLSATQETKPQYLIIDDSEDIDPYDNHSYHPILRAHLEGPDDNLQSSISESEPQEEITQRETEVAVELPNETANNLDHRPDTPIIENQSTVESVSSETSNATDESDKLDESDQQTAPELPAPALPEQVEEQEQPHHDHPSVSHEDIEEKSHPNTVVSILEESAEERAPPDQSTSVNFPEEPVLIRSKEESSIKISTLEITDGNQLSSGETEPPHDEQPIPSDTAETEAYGDKPSPPPELQDPVVPEVKFERPAQIKPGRIPMKESSPQYPPSTFNPSDTIKPKSSIYQEEEEQEDYQFNMFSDVTPKMAIFSGLTILSLIGGMVYQLMLNYGNKPLVQSANTKNVTKSTTPIPGPGHTPAQSQKDREIVMLEKKIKLLERKLYLAPLQATLRKLINKDVDSRLSESKSFLKQLRQYQYKLDENRKLRSKVVADRYERLLQIRNLKDINKIPGVIRYIDYHRKVKSREMSICEMQAEDEFLREQIDLFRELVSEFEKEYSSLSEEINRVKAVGLDLERERSNIAVN